MRRLLNVMLAARLVALPFGLLTAPAQAAETRVFATLPLKNAPVVLTAAELTVVVKVGESRSEQAERERREAEAARLQAEAAAQQAAIGRQVLARYAPHRLEGGLTPEQARDLTIRFANQYGVDPAVMAKIVACESGYNQFAKNSRSTASGYGQFLAGTWRSTIARLGWDTSISPFDGERNLEVTAFLLSQSGTRPWAASARCWSR